MEKNVTVTVDRTLGSYHHEHKDMYYPINYWYAEGIPAPDGEEHDTYISNLLDVLLRACGIPTGISYQRLTFGDARNRILYSCVKCRLYKIIR